MLITLLTSFRLIANAVYNAYAGQRHVESLKPRTLFLQGVPFDMSELQKSFRFVGVKPPDLSPPSVQKIIFLDESFEPYKAVLEGKITEKDDEKGREEHWAQVILGSLDSDKKGLLRVGSNHVCPSSSLLGKLTGFRDRRLPKLLQEGGVELQIVDRIADVNEVFGK